MLNMFVVVERIKRNPAKIPKFKNCSSGFAMMTGGSTRKIQV